jgi:hypothetical protein
MKQALEINIPIDKSAQASKAEVISTCNIKNILLIALSMIVIVITGFAYNFYVKNAQVSLTPQQPNSDTTLNDQLGKSCIAQLEAEGYEISRLETSGQAITNINGDLVSQYTKIIIASLHKASNNRALYVFACEQVVNGETLATEKETLSEKPVLTADAQITSILDIQQIEGTDYFAAEKGSGDGLDVFIFKRNGEVVIDSVLAVNSELSNKHISIAYDAMQKLYLTVASFTDDTKLEAVINPQNGKVERTNAISD